MKSSETVEAALRKIETTPLVNFHTCADIARRALDPTEAPEPVAEFTEAMYGPGRGTTP